jgi:hypothetical protein
MQDTCSPLEKIWVPKAQGFIKKKKAEHNKLVGYVSEIIQITTVAGNINWLINWWIENYISGIIFHHSVVDIQGTKINQRFFSSDTYIHMEPLPSPKLSHKIHYNFSLSSLDSLNLVEAVCHARRNWSFSLKALWGHHLENGLHSLSSAFWWWQPKSRSTWLP